MRARADDPVHTFSRGMVQRTAVCPRGPARAGAAAARRAARGPRPGRGGARSAPLIAGGTRVVISHDVEHGLAAADLVLGLRGGRSALLRARGRRDRRRRAGAVRMRRAVGALIRKDVRLELRTPRVRAGDGAVLARDVRAVPLRAGRVARSSGTLAAGILWVTLLFAAVLGINRLFVAEREEGGFDGFLLAPVDRTVDVRGQGDGAVRVPVRGRGVRAGGVRDPAARPVAVAPLPSWCSCCCWPTSGSR